MSSPSNALSSVTIISKCPVFPELAGPMFDKPIKLSISDLPMLSCHYIQKGVLLTTSPHTTEALLTLIKTGLSKTLSHFPPLSGRLITDPDGIIYVTPCHTESGVDFMHASARHVSINDVISPADVPDVVKDEFFPFNGAVSYDGHFMPLMAVQVTELLDGVFIGCAVNHSVIDGTSFWNFFNAFADVCRGVTRIWRPLDFEREFVKDSQAVLSFPDGKRPTVTFDVNGPLRERIFHFSREAILNLKSRANAHLENKSVPPSEIAERMGKRSNDQRILEISSFQSLCAQLWRAVTRARKHEPSKPTTFRMAVNCRHRLKPKLDQYYFGNAIQSAPTVASAGEILSRDLRWSADMLRRGVAAHDDAAVRRIAEEWERNPLCFPLGNLDGATLTMGSSPRFPMYENDFGWGRPVAVRSGRANKFDGKMSAFPGRDEEGSVDLEVCLAPETMAGIETDEEFMQYVSNMRELGLENDVRAACVS